MKPISRMTSPESLPLVMTADDVASLCGVNRKTIYDACKNKELPFTRIGRLHRFHRDAVLEWLRGKGSVSRSRK